MANRILFIIYTPYDGYLPKRMAELEKKATLEGVAQIVTTPSTYQTDLEGQQAETVHLIKLYPDQTDANIDSALFTSYYNNEKFIEKFVEGIKVHNI